MPSTLPPSSTGIGASGNDDSAGGGGASKPKYVVSASGHAAHPDDIIASCRALQAHISKMQEDADRELKELDDRIRARELAEKRRVAPGWLDSDARLLEPERNTIPATETSAPLQSSQQAPTSTDSELATDQGAELDRAFGGMNIR